MRSIPRSKLIGGALVALGLVVLMASVSASIGLVSEERAAPGSPARTMPGDDTAGSTLDLTLGVGEVHMTKAIPLDALPLEALPIPDDAARGVRVGLPLGVAAGLGVDAAPDASREPGPSSAAVMTTQQRALPPAAQAAAIGAAAFTGAGVIAYFWTSLKTWAFRVAIVPFIPLYARVTRAEVFDNAVRGRIFHAIKAHAGLSASDLAKHAGVSWGTTIYHLEVLEQNRMVTSLRNGRHRRYFENGATLTAGKEVVALLQNPVTANVVQAVRHAPGITQKDLAGTLGMSPQALHWHLQRLAGAGVVTKRREGRVVRHFCA